MTCSRQLLGIVRKIGKAAFGTFQTYRFGQLNGNEQTFTHGRSIDDKDVTHYVIGDANGPVDRIPGPPPHGDPDGGLPA